MSDQHAFGQILAEFGHIIGLDDLALDDDGYAALGIDDKLVVNLERDPNSERVLLYCALGKPGGNALSAYAMLLQANYLGRGTGGATLGLAPDSDMIVLSLFVPFAALDLPGFTRTIEMFINLAEEWSARLPGLGMPTADEASAAAPASQPRTVWG